MKSILCVMGAAYGGYKLGEHYIVDPEAKMDVVER